MLDSWFLSLRVSFVDPALCRAHSPKCSAIFCRCSIEFLIFDNQTLIPLFLHQVRSAHFPSSAYHPCIVISAHLLALWCTFCAHAKRSHSQPLPSYLWPIGCQRGVPAKSGSALFRGVCFYRLWVSRTAERPHPRQAAHTAAIAAPRSVATERCKRGLSPTSRRHRTLRLWPYWADGVERMCDLSGHSRSQAAI